MSEAIATVVRWQNGMVTVFDARGAQIPEFQGRHEDVADLIRQHAPADALFFAGRWRGAGGGREVESIDRDQF